MYVTGHTLVLLIVNEILCICKSLSVFSLANTCNRYPSNTKNLKILKGNNYSNFSCMNFIYIKTIFKIVFDQTFLLTPMIFNIFVAHL